MKLHNVYFKQVGRKMELLLDGMEVKGLRAVRIYSDYDSATEIEIKLVATEVEVEVEPE